MIEFCAVGVMIQIRDVPVPVHRTLKARAAAAGTSLSEYVRGELVEVAQRPTSVELATRIRARGAVEPSEPSEASVRRLRDHGE